MSLFSLSEKAYTILIRDMTYGSRFCFCGPQFVCVKDSFTELHDQ